VAGSFEKGNEALGSIRDGDLHGHVTDSQRLQHGSASWNYLVDEKLLMINLIYKNTAAL
jgi:hypothetical protein